MEESRLNPPPVAQPPPLPGGPPGGAAAPTPPLAVPLAAQRHPAGPQQPIPYATPYGAPSPYAPYPPGYPYPPPRPPENHRARKLVMLSHVLGWGGLAVLFVGTLAAGVVAQSATAAGVVAAVGFALAVAGGIIGQIGRAMQGRVV